MNIVKVLLIICFATLGYLLVASATRLRNHRKANWVVGWVFAIALFALVLLQLYRLFSN